MATSIDASRIKNTILATRSACALVALLLAGAGGCGSEGEQTYPVSGMVLWNDGQPAAELEGATVELQLKNAAVRRVSPNGEVRSDATFTLGSFRRDDGAPEGDYRALVMPQKSQDAEGPHTVYIMNPRFENYDTSGLDVTVEPKENEITLTVERVR